MSSSEKGSENIARLQKEIGAVGERCRKIETLLLSRDSEMTTSLEELFVTFRTISHNQAVLENKLEDALKNQVNTDLMVNNFNERLNKLSESISEISGLHSISSRNNAAVTEISRPSTSSVKRGPGRPRKSASSVGLALSRGSDSNTSLGSVNVSLPTGNVQVPKSKRYFTDPNAKPEQSTKAKEDLVQSRVRAIEKSVESNHTKRRRGRPPKRRVVETVIVANDKIALETDQDELSRKSEEEEEEEETKLNNLERASIDDEATNNNLEPQESSCHIIAGSHGDGNLQKSPLLSSSTRSSMAPNSGIILSTAGTAGSTSARGNEISQEDQQHQQLLEEKVVIVPASRKRILRSSNDGRDSAQDEEIEKQDSNWTSASDASVIDMAANKLQRELQQRELDKRRDSREKMLVSMKYNDRQKAKSFMESNKKLLVAMREEERRKRMTALIYDGGANSTQQALSGSVPSARIQEHIFKLEEKSLAQSKKMGISSMLNDGEEHQLAASFSSPPSPEGAKRRRSLDCNDDSHTLPQLRKKKATNYLTTSSIIGEIELRSSLSGNSGIHSESTNDDNKSDKNTPNNLDIGINGKDLKSSTTTLVTSRAVSSNGNRNDHKKSDSQASLLLTSSIELLCRDGFFFRRSTPENPINVGTYLEFKFKPKEEELINLTVNQKDFIDRTKQDRMNAYFLKPEIQSETEFAFRVLSKTMLTEKYVNSLEYFVMEFWWENKLVGLGLKLRESKRTWQRRKALFSLLEFWRDQSREKRGFLNFTMLHAVKEMENYRIFINRSVSWFYNHITLLKMILYDLCDNVYSQWREWMYAKDATLPTLDEDVVTEANINEALNTILTLDFLDDGTESSQIKSCSTMPASERTTDDEVDAEELDYNDQNQEQRTSLSAFEK